MGYFDDDTRLAVSVETLRENAPSFSGSDSVTFSDRGSFYWRVSPNQIDSGISVLPDVVKVQFGSVSGLYSETDLINASVFQVYEEIEQDDNQYDNFDTGSVSFHEEDDALRWSKWALG